MSTLKSEQKEALKGAFKVLDSIDGPMLKSKKFTGFLLIEISWKILLAYAIFAQMEASVLLTMVAAAGTTETAFMGVQAWHDRHVKPEKMKAMNGSVSRAVDVASGAVPRAST